jgi:O-antigen ligase
MLIVMALLFILLPSVYMDDLMQGAVSGKMFFFLYAILIAGVLLLLKLTANFLSCIRLSKVDILLSVWIIYILLNGLFQQMPISGRLLEFSGLIILYITLRQTEQPQYTILLLSIAIGAFVQAIHGNLQLWGIYPSQHDLFRMTGSFFNPGPFAGYLAIVFPVALGLYLFNIKSLPFVNDKTNRWITGITLIAILTVLPVSGSRAAWLSVIVSSTMILMTHYPIVQHFKKLSRLKQSAILLLFCIVIVAGLVGLFKFKADSANGRLLIWKVTANMIAEHPLTGVGFDRFSAFYMNEQAYYFEQNPESSDAMVAGDTNYSFNEFLQHTVENGFIGLLLMLTIIVYAFRVNNKSYMHMVLIAKAGIVGVIVFSLFSYSAQILPVKICLVCYLSCLSSFDTRKILQIRMGKHVFVKSILAVFIFAGNIFAVRYILIYQEAWKSWGKAHQLYINRNYSESLNNYGKAWPVLKTNGDFLTHYGKSLSMAGKHKQAIEILKQATKYYPNIVLYTTLGDSYKSLKMISEAGSSYLQAWYMNPSRFYPKYLLAKLYDENGQAEKATAIARELLNKEVKIESTAIQEIRAEMEEILRKYQGVSVGFKLQKWKSPQGEKIQLNRIH